MSSHPESEPFHTLKQAAQALNLKYWMLLKAANRGLFPTYTLLTSRRLVRLSEIAAAITRVCKVEAQDG